MEDGGQCVRIKKKRLKNKILKDFPTEIFPVI